MQQSPSWKAISSASKARHSQLHTRMEHKGHKSSLTATILSHLMHYTTSHSISLRSVLILSFLLSLVLPSRLLPSGFPINNLYALLAFARRISCSTHLIFLDLIGLAVFGEEALCLCQVACSSCFICLAFLFRCL